MSRPPKFDDEVILDRAMRAFWRRGWTSTSIRELEAELDLRAPSIYRRFENKDGLARAVLERYVDRVIGGRVARHLDGDGDPIDNVRAFLRSAVVSPSPDEPLVGCLLTTTATEHPTLSADLDDVIARGFERIRAGLGDELGRAAAAGQLADGVDAGAATAVVALAFQGLMVHARRGRPSEALLADADAAVRAVAPGRSD